MDGLRLLPEASISANATTVPQQWAALYWLATRDGVGIGNDEISSGQGGFVEEVINLRATTVEFSALQGLAIRDDSNNDIVHR